MRSVLLTAGGLMAALAFGACGGGGGTDSGTDVVTHPDTGGGDAGADAHSDGGPGTDAGASKAGLACSDDTMCGTAGVLMCDTTLVAASFSQGICTGSCTNGAAAAETSECDGPGSTCLTIGDTNPNSFCTHACHATGASSGCLTDEVCTGWWYTHANQTPDTPGCFPFCHANTDCATGTTCNTYTGACSATAVDPTKAIDGEPCLLAHDGSTAALASDCRSGICFNVGVNTTHGLCGSFIDTRLTQTCPDDPNMNLPPQAPAGDNLALCVFKQCTCDSDCTAPTVCVTMTGGGICAYPDTTMGQTGTACTPDGGTDSGTDAATDAATGTDAGVDVAVPVDAGGATDVAVPLG